MKEKMYSFIAHPVNSSKTGEYIEHSITEKHNVTLDEMLEWKNKNQVFLKKRLKIY